MLIPSLLLERAGSESSTEDLVGDVTIGALDAVEYEVVSIHYSNYRER